MKPQVMGGIQERAEAFVKKCTESQGASLDAYVSSECEDGMKLLNRPGLSTLLRFGLCFASSVSSVWHTLY